MKLPLKNPLFLSCLIGGALAACIFLGLLFARSLPQGPGGSSSDRRAFTRELAAYDEFDAPRRLLAGEDPQVIERRLGRLQRQVRHADEQLSVLKRRRDIALIDRRYIGSYIEACREAAASYPFSSPMALLAAEALTLGGYPLSDTHRSLMLQYAPRVSQHTILELSLYYLSGNLDHPEGAVALPDLALVLSRIAAQDDGGLPPLVHEDIGVLDFLLKSYRGDHSGAQSRLYSLLSGPRALGMRTMAAEYYYDHGAPLRAAELFLSLGGEDDLVRAADALVLSGESPGARNIWLALASPGGALGESANRSLYNLAATSPSPLEEARTLETIFSRHAEFQRHGGRNSTAQDDLLLYSTIRYTRLLDTERSISVLESEGPHPLMDLEILRRRLDILPPGRASGEVWLLLERNPQAEALYQWAAWYFDHQKLYSETALVLREAERRDMGGPWLDYHRALALLRDGHTLEAERILGELDRTGQSWRVKANLGRIQEERRVIQGALEHYEGAALFMAALWERSPSAGGLRLGTSSPQEAAQLQLRISRCLESLGRFEDSIRAMGLALELDPSDLLIRRESRRLGLR
ncbi:MAG: hypothetical protein FWH12_04665 [Treponema sp.]|nr:hypothetical protein [Treponema sp.]